MLKTGARVAVLGVGLYVGDLWFNDDLDAMTRRFRRKLPVEEQEHRPRVVVLGSGFGALNLVRRLHTDRFRVTVVSPQNYFTFTPMLTRAMSGEVEPSSIIEPFRRYCRRARVGNVRFIEAEALQVVPGENRVVCRDTTLGASTNPVAPQVSADTAAAHAADRASGKVETLRAEADRRAHGDRVLDLEYDYLVVAVGSEPKTFGIKGALDHAFMLRDVRDSQRIRNHVLDCFEAASMPGQSEETIDRLLHFTVVGAGFAGCEVTAELRDFVMRDLCELFPQFKGRVRFTIVEAMSTVMAGMPQPLVEFARDAFQRHDVDVKLNSKVTSIGPDSLGVTLEDGTTSTIDTNTVIWATGNGVRDVVKDLGKRVGGPQSKCYRGLGVDEHLRVQGTSNIWAIGDCASSGLPPTATVATQQGAYLARVLNETAEILYDRVLPKNQLLQGYVATGAGASVEDVGAGAGDSKAASGETADDAGTDPMAGIPPFAFSDLGAMGYVGDKEAVFSAHITEGKDLTVSGRAAWWMYRSVFFSRLLSARNRVFVGADVLKSTVFGRNVSRW